MPLTWFLVLSIGAVLAKGNKFCNGKGTELPTTATLACGGTTMTVFVDGTKLKGEKVDPIMVEGYGIPVGSSVLAIHCKQETLVARILGMVGKTMLTGSNEWLCTNHYHERWNTRDFVDSSWAPGVSAGKNRKHTLPYGRVVNISSEAEWIGTGENSTRNNTLYCRVLLCQTTKSCTYFSGTRIDNYRLIDHALSTFHSRNIAECALKCAELIGRCFSFNYIATTTRERLATCELNNSTQLMKPASFLPTQGVVYYFKTTYP